MNNSRPASVPVSQCMVSQPGCSSNVNVKMFSNKNKSVAQIKSGLFHLLALVG